MILTINFKFCNYSLNVFCLFLATEGGQLILPGFDHALVYEFTIDNTDPPTADEVRYFIVMPNDSLAITLKKFKHTFKQSSVTSGTTAPVETIL